MNHSLNEQLMARKAAALPRGVGVMDTFSPTAPTTPNCGTWKGRALHRFAGGIAVMNSGHGHPKVVAAIEAAAEEIHPPAYQVVALRATSRWPKLNALTPDRQETALFSTGAEAIENAIKIARVRRRCSAVIAFPAAAFDDGCSTCR